MSSVNYTPAQENFIRKNYKQGIDRQKFMSMFNNRFKTNKSAPALFDKAKKMGVIGNVRTNNKYTKKEEQYIIDNYGSPLTGIEFTKVFNNKFKTNRSVTALKNKAASFGKTKGARFTDEEIEFLKENANKYSRIELTKLFNKKFKKNRTYTAIADACCYRGYKMFTHRDDGEVWVENNNKHKYMKIKLSKKENKIWKKASGYVSYAQYIWWKHTNHIPQKGEVIVYIDGDTMNCNFDNLYLLDSKSFARFRKSGLMGINHPVLKTLVFRQCQIETIIKEEKNHE